MRVQKMLQISFDRKICRSGRPWEVGETPAGVSGWSNDVPVALVTSGGDTAEQLHAGRVDWGDEHHGKVGVVDRHRRILADEVLTGQRRRRRHPPWR
jgi:hypothetical protein